MVKKKKEIPHFSSKKLIFTGGPSDVWSFGVCFYQCFMDDEVPSSLVFCLFFTFFLKQNFDAFACVSNPLLSIRDFLDEKDVSGPVQDVICSCLKVKQEERPPADVLLQRLLKCVHD